MHQPRKSRHPRRRNIRIGRNPVIGQTIPPRKMQNRHVRAEKGQRRAQIRKALVITRYMHDRPAGFLDLIKDQARVKPFRGTANGYVLRHRICSCSDSLAERRGMEILIHAPERSDKNRHHTNKLNVEPVPRQAFAKRHTAGILLLDARRCG